MIFFNLVFSIINFLIFSIFFLPRQTAATDLLLFFLFFFLLFRTGRRGFMATTLLQRQINLFSLFLPFFLLSHSPLPRRHSNDDFCQKSKTQTKRSSQLQIASARMKRERGCVSGTGREGRKEKAKKKSIVKLIFFLILACNVDCLIRMQIRDAKVI